MFLFRRWLNAIMSIIYFELQAQVAEHPDCQERYDEFRK